jgi:hypothetical protein
MPADPRDARAVVPNHVLARSRHTPQDQTWPNSPGVLATTTVVPNLHMSGPVLQPDHPRWQVCQVRVLRGAALCHHRQARLPAASHAGPFHLRQRPPADELFQAYPRMSAPLTATRVILVSLPAGPNSSRPNRRERFAHRENYDRLTR